MYKHNILYVCNVSGVCVSGVCVCKWCAPTQTPTSTHIRHTGSYNSRNKEFKLKV